MDTAKRRGRRLNAARPWFGLFLAYLLLVQTVLSLGLSTQHSLAAIAPEIGPVFCHAEGTPPPVPSTPDHTTTPLMAACAICAFASADYTPPAEMGVAPLARNFIRLHASAPETTLLLVEVRSTTRLSQGPPNVA